MLSFNSIYFLVSSELERGVKGWNIPYPRDPGYWCHEVIFGLFHLLLVLMHTRNFKVIPKSIWNRKEASFSPTRMLYLLPRNCCGHANITRFGWMVLCTSSSRSQPNSPSHACLESGMQYQVAREAVGSKSWETRCRGQDQQDKDNSHVWPRLWGIDGEVKLSHTWNPPTALSTWRNKGAQGLTVG